MGTEKGTAGGGSLEVYPVQVERWSLLGALDLKCREREVGQLEKPLVLLQPNVSLRAKDKSILEIAFKGRRMVSALERKSVE